MGARRVIQNPEQDEDGSGSRIGVIGKPEQRSQAVAARGHRVGRHELKKLPACVLMPGGGSRSEPGPGRGAHRPRRVTGVACHPSRLRRATLDLAEAGTFPASGADVVVDAQDETERLREFTAGHADCLRVNPWSPLCNKWSAEANLAAAEATLADLEADMDLAFARAAVVRIPSDAARADADAAFAAAAGVGTAAMAAATATLGLSILTAHRARPVGSWRGGERQ